tara:strand:+ start:847 stop:1071 length:225 start_codon:yes stop_codon:yes gene_type:complete
MSKCNALFQDQQEAKYDRWVSDQREYITIEGVEIECDMSFTTEDFPCVIMSGPLAGFEIVLDRAFINRKLAEVA